jgi:hypothetical protein
MARGKSSKIKPFEKLMVVLVNAGKAVTLEEMETLLGNDLYMYRKSSYILDIKLFTGAIIRANKDGRKVVSYEIMNANEVKNGYMKRMGIVASDIVPSSIPKAPSVAKVVTGKKKVTKLADLGAVPKTKTKTKAVPKKVMPVEELEVVEITPQVA